MAWEACPVCLGWALLACATNPSSTQATQPCRPLSWGRAQWTKAQSNGACRVDPSWCSHVKLDAGNSAVQASQAGDGHDEKRAEQWCMSCGPIV
eukprot:1159725-Pelagomonas_calceolata.AAC.14